MENSYGKNLVIVIGGYLRPEENRKAWLARIAKAAGISVREAYAAYYREYVSKKTERALQKAAQQRVRTDDDERIAWIESHIAHLEAVDPAFFGPDIAAARSFLAAYRGYAETRVFATVPEGDRDDPEGG